MCVSFLPQDCLLFKQIKFNYDKLYSPSSLLIFEEEESVEDIDFIKPLPGIHNPSNPLIIQSLAEMGLQMGEYEI